LLFSFYSLWHITHPIGCPAYVRPTDPSINDTAPAQCIDLSLTQIECNLPLCPFPNDTKASGLDTSISTSKLLSSNSTRKNGTQVQFQCTTPCNFFQALKRLFLRNRFQPNLVVMQFSMLKTAKQFFSIKANIKNLKNISINLLQCKHSE